MTRGKSLFIYHICVLLWGFTSILGKLISFEAISLVWWRLLLVTGALLLYFSFDKSAFKVNRKTLLKLFGIGLIIAVHWVALYGAIKVSNIAITMISFSSISFFSAIVEPLFFKRKIIPSELIIGLLVIIGISLIAAHTKGAILGYILGVTAAFTASLFTVMNGLMIKETASKTITFYELLGALIWLSIYILAVGFDLEYLINPSLIDLGWLIILAVACTAVPFLLSLRVMHQLSPFTINLIINLEVIYAIVIGFLIFGDSEKMTPQFYVGSMLIILLIVLNGYIKKKASKKLKDE